MKDLNLNEMKTWLCLEDFVLKTLLEGLDLPG